MIIVKYLARRFALFAMLTSLALLTSCVTDSGSRSTEKDVLAPEPQAQNKSRLHTTGILLAQADGQDQASIEEVPIWDLSPEELVGRTITLNAVITSVLSPSVLLVEPEQIILAETLAIVLRPAVAVKVKLEPGQAVLIYGRFREFDYDELVKAAGGIIEDVDLEDYLGNYMMIVGEEK